MNSIWNLLFLFSLFVLKIHAYEYDLSICTIFRDDARFLKEWIEYHKLIGVQHFYLFDNLSQDDYLTVLEPYIISGEVSLTAWPHESNDMQTWDRIQRQAYEKGVELSIGVSKWLAIIDTDEFIVPMLTYNLVDFLKDYEDYGGLGINWVTFGTSGVTKIPEDKLMIETLLLRAKDHEVKASHWIIKSIVQPERIVFPIKSVHSLSYKNGFGCVDTDFGNIFNEITTTIKFDKVRLHHYRFRDRDFFYNIKIPRQSKYCASSRAISIESVCNEVYDDTMLRFVPLLSNAIKNK